MKPKDMELKFVADMASAVAEETGLNERDKMELHRLLSDAYAHYKNKERGQGDFEANRIDVRIAGTGGTASVFVSFEDARPTDEQNARIKEVLDRCMCEVCTIMSAGQSNQV